MQPFHYQDKFEVSNLFPIVHFKQVCLNWSSQDSLSRKYKNTFSLEILYSVKYEKGMKSFFDSI